MNGHATRWPRIRAHGRDGVRTARLDCYVIGTPQVHGVLRALELTGDSKTALTAREGDELLEGGSSAADVMGLEVHTWLSHCGLACGLHPNGCTAPPSFELGSAGPLVALDLCAAWLLQSSWSESPLA